MSDTPKALRALIFGVEHYRDQDADHKRPGTLQALREIAARLGESAWQVRVLTDDATSVQHRAGLTQLLEGVAWATEGECGLIILSGRVKEGRIYPADYKEVFLNQTTVKLTDLIDALTPQTGLIVDGAISKDLITRLSWGIAADDQERELSLFSSYGPTRFLHALTVTLNTWPMHEELKVSALFQTLKKNGAPEHCYQHYSSLESVSLLTPSMEVNKIGDTLLSQEAPPIQHLKTPPVESGGGRFLAKGRFQLLRMLGEGGIGEVHLARDVRLNKLRAVKLLKLPDQLTDEQREHIRGRMIQSARAAQELSEYTHHVVQVYDMGLDERTELPFMVMEYLEGITLNARLYQEPRLSLDQIFMLGLTLCETLAIAHNQNVIHRDLKPENVMLIQRDGTDLFLKLLDFDLVKVEAGEVQTKEGQILGTLEYMAPEQLKGQEIDARADVYALGAILYECFSGKRANPGRNQRELVKLLLGDGARSLKEVSPELPLDLCKLLDSCLSLNPDDRPPNAAALAELLRPLQKHRESLSLMNVPLVSLSELTEASTPDTITTSGSEETFSTPLPSATETAPPLGAVSTPALHAQDSASAPSARYPRLFWVVGVIVAMLLIGFILKNQVDDQGGVPSRAPQKGDEDSREASLQTDAHQRTERPSSMELQHLQPQRVTIQNLDWREVQVNPVERPDGWYRTYQGGRFEARLSRFVYDLYYRHREGDPVVNEWAEHARLRKGLFALAPLSALRSSGDQLLLPQSVYEELLTQRPSVDQHEQIAQVFQLDQGLMVLSVNGKKCRELKVGDLITQMTWTVKGKRSLNGQCAGKACLNSHQRALNSRGVMELTLTLTVQIWEQEEMWISRALPEPQEERRICKF